MKCPECLREDLGTLGELEGHLREEHLFWSAYQCSLCPYSNAHYPPLLSHCQNSHREQEYSSKILYEVSIPKAEQLKFLLSRAGVGAEQSCPVCGVAPPASSLPPHLALRAHVRDHLCYRPFGCPHCAEYSAPSCLELTHHYKLKHCGQNLLATVRFVAEKEEEIDELLQGKAPSSQNESHPMRPTPTLSRLSLEGRQSVKSPQPALDIPKQEPVERPMLSTEQQPRGSSLEQSAFKRRNQEPLVEIIDITNSPQNSECSKPDSEAPRFSNIPSEAYGEISGSAGVEKLDGQFPQAEGDQRNAAQNWTHRSSRKEPRHERRWEENLEMPSSAYQLQPRTLSIQSSVGELSPSEVPTVAVPKQEPRESWTTQFETLTRETFSEKPNLKRPKLESLHEIIDAALSPENKNFGRNPSAVLEGIEVNDRPKRGWKLGALSENKANHETLRMECHICWKKIKAFENKCLIQHVLSHVENPHLFQCSACDYKACRKDMIRKSVHKKRDWDDSCFKGILNDATRRRVNACFKLAFPFVQWSGSFHGVDFTAKSDQSETSLKSGTRPRKRRAKSDWLEKPSKICHICSKEIQAPSKFNLMKHALTHVDEPHLFQCGTCNRKAYRMDEIKRIGRQAKKGAFQHWGRKHSERDWDHNSFKEILNDATRRRVNARFKEAFPSFEWNGIYEGLDFTVQSNQ